MNSSSVSLSLAIPFSKLRRRPDDILVPSSDGGADVLSPDSGGVSVGIIAFVAVIAGCVLLLGVGASIFIRRQRQLEGNKLISQSRGRRLIIFITMTRMTRADLASARRQPRRKHLITHMSSSEVKLGTNLLATLSLLLGILSWTAVVVAGAICDGGRSCGLWILYD